LADLQEFTMQGAIYGPAFTNDRINSKTRAHIDNFSYGENLENLSDEKLIDKCRTGSREAFDVLIKRYERPIYHLAYRLSGNYDDAHDIAAETFLRIYRAIGTFQCAITLPAWINRIVANVFYDTRRHAYRHPAVSLDALVEKTGDSLLANEKNTARSPHAEAEENEKKSILARAIQSLPDYQRMMVTLFHSEGRTYEEIADIMKIPVGTVKSRLNRARLALRERLAPQMSALMS
jgi:RNA polymerase sigma-70 factor (ECF subfamily)